MPPSKAPAAKRGNGDGDVWQISSGLWRWEIVLGYTTKPDGSRKRETKSGTAKTRTVAKRAKALAIADKERGTLAMPDRVTLSEWLEKWLETRSARVSKNTAVSYSGIIKKHIAPHLGNKKLQALKPVDLRNYYSKLASLGLTPKTMRNIHGVLYGALEDAMKLELVMRNDANIIRPEAPPQNNNAKASQAWTAAETAQFLVAARGDRLYALFYLLLSMGLRRGEACGLRWANVDFERRMMRVEEALICVAGKAEISTPKTRKSRRPIRLPSELVEVLHLHKAAQDQMHLEHGVTPTADNLFTTAKGTPIHPDNVNRSFERLCEFAGLRRVRVHDLRHTHASLLRRAGVSIEVISEKLGHARSSFTGDVYLHTFEDEHDAATLNLSELLSNRPLAKA